MRAFASRVGVMSSKARPKKLAAYAVPGTMKITPSLSQINASSGRQNGDAGEIHFLVKQEAKGDLRKDARVQDLNNVINRLMTSSSESAGYSRRRRRLHLTTFSVVCLSEDIGILEWVPNTDSLRNLVTKSYNPQVSLLGAVRQSQRPYWC
jgi:serine/threonine-protein kinase ATR